MVAPTLDQFDVLRIERTSAANYDLQTEDLITELMSIDQQYGIDIITADAGTIEFTFKQIPPNHEESHFLDWLENSAPDSDPPNTWKSLIKLGWD